MGSQRHRDKETDMKKDRHKEIQRQREVYKKIVREKDRDRGREIKRRGPSRRSFTPLLER